VLLSIPQKSHLPAFLGFIIYLFTLQTSVFRKKFGVQILFSQKINPTKELIQVDSPHILPKKNFKLFLFTPKTP